MKNAIITIIDNKNDYPITLEEVKKTLKISHDLEDDILTNLIDYSCKYAENYLQKSITHKKILATFHNITSNRLSLAYGPVKTIEEVKIYDYNNKYISTSKYSLDGDDLKFSYLSFSSRIDVIYEVQALLAPDINLVKEGLITHVALLYANRFDSEIPYLVTNFYQPLKGLRLA